MQLTRNVLKESKKYSTPSLLLDLQLLRKNYHAIKNSVKGVEVFYAMKANDHDEVLKVLRDEGSSFEISSLNELRHLYNLAVPPEKIMCLNSIKNQEFLEEMYKTGVKIMAFDSTYEVDKIAKYAPGSQVILRINVTNEGSDWPLTRKFGVDANEGLDLMLYAKKKKLKPIGITFHVGSQCLNKNNWANALYVCDDIWSQAYKHGIELSFISLGGGMPVQHIKPIPSIIEIGKVIEEALAKNFKVSHGTLRVSIEPGRGMVGDTAIMATTVVGRATRGNEEWIYTDVGVFNGLMETIEEFQYEVRSESKKPLKTFTIAGPSCDSVDITFKNIKLPDVTIGDRLYIMNAGSYTTVYAAPFNGFPVPEVHFIKQ